MPSVSVISTVWKFYHLRLCLFSLLFLSVDIWKFYLFVIDGISEKSLLSFQEVFGSWEAWTSLYDVTFARELHYDLNLLLLLIVQYCHFISYGQTAVFLNEMGWKCGTWFKLYFGNVTSEFSFHKEWITLGEVLRDASTSSLTASAFQWRATLMYYILSVNKVDCKLPPDMLDAYFWNK